LLGGSPHRWQGDKMKYVKMYLMVSSIVLHIVLIALLFWAGPFFSNALNSAKELAQSLQSPSEKGIVANVSEIIRGEYRYKGYLIKYNGQDLYVMGTGKDNIEKGDQVNVLIQEHPYAPTKSLMVVVTKSEKK
jgi:membrane protein implicated in regulation of membrane protease activity